MSARSENDGPAASLTTKQVLTAMKNLTVHSKQGAVSLNDLVWHFVNADSKGRNRGDAAAPEGQKAFRAKIVELLRQGAGEGACYMVKPNIYRLGAEQRNKGVAEKNYRSDAGPTKVGDLEAILEAHLNAQKKKAKVCKQTKSSIAKDENQTINSIASIASIELQDVEKNANATKKKVDRRMNSKSQDKGRESIDQENETNEPKRGKNRKIAARKPTTNLSKVDGENGHQDSIGSLASNDHSQAETTKPDRRRGRPRKIPAVRRPRKMVAEDRSGDQANPDDVTGTTVRKPRARRVKSAPVKRAGRRAAVGKMDDAETEIRRPPAKMSVPIPDLDLENLTRAQSFEFLSAIFAREARRETKRLNRHGKKTVATAPKPPAKDDGREGSMKELAPLTPLSAQAEGSDSLGKMIVDENPELNAMSREEGTAV